MKTTKQLLASYRRTNSYKKALAYVHTLSQVVFPMSMLHLLLTDEQIARYSKSYDFDENAEFFHFSHDDRMLESSDFASIEWHNDGLPEVDWLVFYEHLPKEAQDDFVKYAKK